MHGPGTAASPIRLTGGVHVVRVTHPRLLQVEYVFP